MIRGQKCKKRAPLKKTVVVKRANGRPSIRTPELVDELCLRIASGRTIQSVAYDVDMPDHAVLYRWRSESSEFNDRIELAREERKEVTRAKLVDLGDRVIEDKMLDPNRVNAAAHAYAKAEAMSGPKKQRVEMTGANGAPIQIDDVSDLELARRIAFLFSAVEAAKE